MLTGKKAVIFDMDGSLVDSMWIWPEVDRIYMDKYHLTAPDTFHRDIEGMSYVETAQYFVDTFTTLNQTVEDVMQEWRDMTVELYATKVFPKAGAVEFLDLMKQNGIRLGIATSNDREIAEAALNGRGLTKYFDSVRTSSEVAAGKPAPDVYLKVADDMNVDPKNCLVFEDVINGILAGKNAGMEVCAVADDFTKADEAEKKAAADYFIRDFFDVLKTLTKGAELKNMNHDFLPVCREDMEKRGWKSVDFAYIIGDGYVDHPSFGHAIISRLLESRGYRVGIISQPDWKDPESICIYGEPRLGFLVSAGNMDSMVNHYSVSKNEEEQMLIPQAERWENARTMPVLCMEI